MQPYSRCLTVNDFPFLHCANKTMMFMFDFRTNFLYFQGMEQAKLCYFVVVDVQPGDTKQS